MPYEELYIPGVNVEGTNFGPPVSNQDVSGHQIASSSDTSTKARQLHLTKIPVGYSPFSPIKNENVYKRMIDCAQYSLDSISASVRDNTILVTGTKTGQQDEDGNVLFDTTTDIPCIMPEGCNMEKVKAWLDEDKILYISVPLKH
ncbi:uncharacterized protein LOC106640357 [Copidosoma floridanum]|uniref:uncharacterized protein LOC106640357 n=1 Tax=Copidosoma floridanum TaxID=29053 RepID=UPI0006C9542D|nr:uncharacterized protein LOC106640357 [Copidosoma floridanum]